MAVNKDELDKYNQSLRESVDLSRQLAKFVGDLSTNTSQAAAKNRQLVDSAKEYADTLRKTERLAERISKGKVKDTEIAKQLKSLEEKYQTYLTNSNSQLGLRGKIYKQQRDLQKEIVKLEGENITKLQATVSADQKIDGLYKSINEQRERASHVLNPTEKRNALDLVESLKDQIKEQLNNVRIRTEDIKNNEKAISQKIKEKEKLGEIVKEHKEIVKNYTNEEKALKLLRDLNKENSILNKLQSKDLDTFVQGIKGAVTFMAPLVAGFAIVKNFAFKISEETTKLQKNLVISRDSAYDVRQDFNNIAVSSGDIAVNTARLIEANTALGKELGFNADFSVDMNVQFVKLTKQIGLSVDAAGGLAKLSKVTGLSLKDTKEMALGTTQQLSSQYGIQLDQKEVLEEIGKISGQTLAMFKASPKALAEAVAQSRLLGTNLETVKKQASFLLDFESSIEAELQAELLTGKQFNLERARAAALTGDLTTAMKELTSQNLDFNKYSNMNVIAQNKVAAALGLSSDELANQLLKQQYMGKSREQILALGGKEVADRIEALSAQEKFNLAVEKMQDIVGGLVAGPLGKFADIMASILTSTGGLVTALSIIGGFSIAKLVIQLGAAAVQAGLLAASSVSTALALTGGIAAAGIVAGLAIWSVAQAKSAQATKLAEGGLAYGPTNAIVGEYSGANNNPEVIAPLSDLQSILNSRGGIGGSDSGETSKLLAILNETMKDVKNSINQIGNREGKVYLGGQQVGTAQLMGNYNLA